MAFQLPTLDEVHGFLVADFYNTFRDEEPDVSEGSFNWLWLRTFAAGVTGNHAHINSLISDLMPDTAEGELLRRWATIKGLSIKEATPARKSKALRVFGTATTVVPSGTVLNHASGITCEIASDEVIGPGLYADCDIVAIDTGSATRLNEGEELKFAIPVAGLEETCKLVSDMDEDGTDAELDGDLQARLKKRFSDPPRGGSIADYVAWATDITGIAEGYCYPIRRGWGTVDVVALHKGTSSDRMLSSPEVADVKAAMDAKRPVGVKGFRVLETEAEPQNVEVTITPDGAEEHAFDWDDTTPPTVSAWDSGLRKVTFGTRPDTMKAGDRLTFESGATGKERVIDSLDGANAVILTVDEDGDSPTVTEVAYAGGALVQAARQAILDHFAALGPANPDAKRYGQWEGNLRPGAVYRAATSVEGVLDGTVIAPAALVEASDPAYPDGVIVGLLVPGRVLVRWEH